jgi:hypothetical protein
MLGTRNLLECVSMIVEEREIPAYFPRSTLHAVKRCMRNHDWYKR